SSFFGKMPQSRINPDEVVAIGAAIQGAALESKLAGGPLPNAPSLSAGPFRPRRTAPAAPNQEAGERVGDTKMGLAEPSKTILGTGEPGPQPPIEAARTPQRPLSGVAAGRSRMKTLSGVGDGAPG